MGEWRKNGGGLGADTTRHTEMGDTKGLEISPRFWTRHVTQVTTQKAFFFFLTSYILFFMEDSSSGVIALVRATSPQILQKTKQWRQIYFVHKAKKQK